MVGRAGSLAAGRGELAAARSCWLNHEGTLAAAHHAVAPSLALEGRLSAQLARPRGQPLVLALEGVKRPALLVGRAALGEPLLERRGVEAEHDRQQDEKRDSADPIPADPAVAVETTCVSGLPGGLRPGNHVRRRWARRSRRGGDGHRSELSPRWPGTPSAQGRCQRRKTDLPGYSASVPSASSMRRSWLYLATRSDREGAPVLIWPQPVATARSAIVVSSVSPER